MSESYASSLDPMHHYRVLRVVDLSYAWSLGPMRRRCVLPIVGSYAPSMLGPTLRRWPLRSVIVSYPSSLCPTLRRWALRVVVGSYVSSSSGPTCCCWGPTRCLVGESVGDGLHHPGILLAVVDFESPLLGSTRR